MTIHFDLSCKREIEWTLLLLSIITIFLSNYHVKSCFSRSPITFILALKSLNLYPINSISVPVQIAAHVLAYSNVCLNPFIYAAAHPGFRNSFKHLLFCGRLQRSPGHAAAVDFERTDTTGETGTFLRTRSLRLVSRAFSRSSRTTAEKNETDPEMMALPTAPESNVTTTNHVDNGANYAEESKFVIKKKATRQDSKDSVF